MPLTKRFKTVVLTLCLLAAIHLLPESALTAGDEIDHQAIDDYVAAKMRAPRIPGVGLVIVKGDRIVYIKGYGQADESGRPVTSQTSFIIGSVTKAFTALALMQLVEAGKVELDAHVQNYISWFRVADARASTQITVRQLLNQTSGLPMIREPQLWTELDDRALERTVRLLQSAKLDFSPGAVVWILQRELRNSGIDRAVRIRAVL